MDNKYRCTMYKINLYKKPLVDFDWFALNKNKGSRAVLISADIEGRKIRQQHPRRNVVFFHFFLQIFLKLQRGFGPRQNKLPTMHGLPFTLMFTTLHSSYRQAVKTLISTCYIKYCQNYRNKTTSSINNRIIYVTRNYDKYLNIILEGETI